MTNFRHRNYLVGLLAVTQLGYFNPVSAKSFYEVIETAMNSHPDVLKQLASRSAENETLNTIKGEMLPTIDMNAVMGQEKTNSSSIDETLTRKEAGLVLNQLIYDGKSASSRYRAQDARIAASNYALAEVKERIGSSAVNIYLDAVKTREIVRLAEANEVEHVTTLDKVKQLYAGGAGRKGDISLAEGRLAKTRATLVRLQNNVQDADVGFNSLVGEPLSYQVRWPRSPKKILPKTLDEALQIARQANPTLLSAVQNIEAANWEIQSAQSGLYPKVNFELSTTRNEDLDGVEGVTKDYNALIRANWNLMRGGIDKAIIQRSYHTLRESQDNLDRIKRQVIEQASQTWNRYQTAKLRLVQLKKYMLTSREVLDAYEEQFKYGQRQLFNVLDQKNELFDSKVQFMNGRDELIRNAYTLLSQMGILEKTVKESLSKTRQASIEKKMSQKAAKQKAEALAKRAAELKAAAEKAKALSKAATEAEQRLKQQLDPDAIKPVFQKKPAPKPTGPNFLEPLQKSKMAPEPVIMPKKVVPQDLKPADLEAKPYIERQSALEGEVLPSWLKQKPTQMAQRHLPTPLA